MSKIICDVCGTSYPETATQCPICGCVRSSDSIAVAGDTSDASVQNTSSYTYVKGGRFSKANVKKRNSGKPIYNAETPQKSQQRSGSAQNSVSGDTNTDKPKQNSLAPMGSNKPVQPEKNKPAKSEIAKKSNKKGEIGLVIAIVVLLVAIAAVVIYIACSYLLLEEDKNDKNTPGATQQTQEDGTPVTTTTPTVPLAAIKPVNSVIKLDKKDEVFLLEVVTEPAGQDYQLTYTSSDPNIATVDSNGKIVAKSSGEVTITISYGDIKVECKVQCEIQEETPPETTEPTVPVPTYTKDDLTFVDNGYGYDYSLPYSEISFKPYNGNIPAELVEFSSNDETVATVTPEGEVIFVGRGRVVITAKYNDWEIECIIHIN